MENWFQQLKLRTTRWRVPQNIRRHLPADSHIQLELDHTSVWSSNTQDSNARDLDYYPTVEQIFRELSRQTKTKIQIPEAAKQVDFSIVEPLTDQEKEEDYELHLYISTFVTQDTPIGTPGRVHLIVKHPTAPVVDPPTEQQQTPPPAQQTAPPATQTVDPAQTPTGEVEEDNPEYAVSRSILKKLAKEIAIARRNIKLQKRQQGKGKRKLVLADSTDDDDELAASALDIVEDARANKVTIET